MVILAQIYWHMTSTVTTSLFPFRVLGASLGKFRGPQSTPGANSIPGQLSGQLAREFAKSVQRQFHFVLVSCPPTKPSPVVETRIQNWPLNNISSIKKFFPFLIDFKCGSYKSVGYFYSVYSRMVLLNICFYLLFRFFVILTKLKFIFRMTPNFQNLFAHFSCTNTSI